MPSCDPAVPECDPGVPEYPCVTRSSAYNLPMSECDLVTLYQNKRSFPHNNPDLDTKLGFLAESPLFARLLRFAPFGYCSQQPVIECKLDFGLFDF